MQFYAEHGFGLIFTGAEIEAFVKANGCEEEEDVYDFLDVCEETKKNHVVRIYNEEMSGRNVRFLNGRYAEDEDMLVIFTDRQPDAFKAAYVDIYGVITEMLKDGFVFPKGFDWRAHLGYFEWCCVCC